MMVLKPRHGYRTDDKTYICDITIALDELTGYTSNRSLYRHYLYDTRSIKDNTMAIRKPGKTIGVVEIDDDSKIIGCLVDDHSYASDINDVLQRFIGDTVTI